MLRRWGWFVLLHLMALNCLGTSLSFVGNGYYSVVGNTVVLQADKLQNNELFGISGTIRLELWAFSSPYPGTTLGYKMASYVLGQLNGGYYFFNINSGSIPFSLPPPGTWDFSLQAREYVGTGSDGYATRDYINFNSPVRVAGGAYFGDIQIVGQTSWQVVGSTVNMYVERVSNICDLGVSGSLRLDLWATASPYVGGTITGYRFGSVSLNPLTGGYDYNNINQTVGYSQPPGGSYYVTLTLSEYHNGSYVTVDYLNYTNLFVVGNPPPPPTANAATAVTVNEFTANWNSASGAIGYRLDVSTGSAFNIYVGAYQDLNVGSALSQSISGLNQGSTYYYRVRAYNAVGTSGNSGTIAVTLPCNYTITTSSSGGGTTSGGGIKNCGASVTVMATPSAGYQFSNWTEFGNPVSSSSSYQFIANGDRTLVANFVDAQKPSISISSPPTGTTYTNAQTVTITATATDNVGVTQVEFYDGATLAGFTTTPPHTNVWSFTAANNGAHVWTARAYDAAGNASTSSPVTLIVSIDITPPTVVITTPTNGQVLTTTPFTATGTATDPGSPTSGLSAVQVRVNGGTWSNATGTTSWTRSVTLSPCPNTIEARSLDYAGNYSSIASNFVSYTPPNTVPNTPSNVSPANGLTGVSLMPTLQATAFSDPDCVGDSHAASQWQVLNSAGSIVVADSGTDAVNKVSWLVPAAKLYYGSNYVWRVRYQDSRGGWSSYSAQTTFTTGGPLLSGSKQGTNMVFKWPTNALGFSLQWVTNLGLANWSNATPSPLIVSGQYTVTNSMTNTFRIYRLKK
jgi:hypothetical protein